jgi:predicted transcriptional regulator
MIETMTRTERLLAMILLQHMKGATQHQKAIQLSLAGLSNVEIADLLDTTTAVVAQQLYKGRTKSGRKKKSASKSTARKKTTKPSESE